MGNDLLEIVGEDYSDLDDDDDLDLGYEDFEIGARRKPKVTRRDYSRLRRQLLPFGDTGTMAAGVGVDLLANPQVPFKPERLVVQEVTATNGVVVTECKVGKNSQFVSSGEFPSSLFAGNANEGLFQFDTAKPGIDIVISLKNAGAVDANAIVGMVGVSLNK